MPGTLIKVTPLMAAPIIAKATRPHGAWRLPLKNVELLLPREANQLMTISSAKYAAMVMITMVGVTVVLCFNYFVVKYIVVLWYRWRLLRRW